MKLTIKKGDNIFIEDARFYNSCYNSAVSAVEKLKTILKAEEEKKELARIAKEQYENAEQNYKGARQTLQSAGRVVEEYRLSYKNASDLAEKRRIESKLNSAYKIFYEAYNAERDAVATLKLYQGKMMSQREEEVRDETATIKARANVKIAFDRLYQVARMIERKYGFNLGSKEILKNTEYGDENASFEGIEQLNLNIIDASESTF